MTWLFSDHYSLPDLKLVEKFCTLSLCLSKYTCLNISESLHDSTLLVTELGHKKLDWAKTYGGCAKSALNEWATGNSDVY